MSKPFLVTSEDPTPDPGSQVTSRGALPEGEEAWEVYEPIDEAAALAHARSLFGGLLDRTPDARDQALTEASRLYGRDFAAERAALKDGTHPLCRLTRRAG